MEISFSYCCWEFNGFERNFAEMSNIELMRFEISPPDVASYSERYFEILMDEFVSDYQSIGPNREIIELKVSISRFLKNRIF